MMDEYISRETVLNLIKELYAEAESPEAAEALFETHERIAEHPAAVVKPVVKGEWLIVDESYWRGCQSQDKQINRVSLKCSNCGHRITRKDFRGIRNFCPNCGADMRKEAHDDSNL